MAGALKGPLATRGNRILDAAGQTVRIAAVSWFGLETRTFAPHGLHRRNAQDMLAQIAGLGFNAVRIPFSAQALLDGGKPGKIDFRLNPELARLTPLALLDRLIDEAGAAGLGVILDHHRSRAGEGPNANGLWHDGPYTESRWIGLWEQLAERYRGHPAVLGADLSNEPHAAEWDDWAAAAERAGNAILAKNPDWLILVEGVSQYFGRHYWWGGNLLGVRHRPVRLSRPDRLVYSPHDYPNSVYTQPFFRDPAFPGNMRALFDGMWGYVGREGIAPVLLGEFGSRLQDPLDRAWMREIVAHLQAEQASFAWWSWNPDSHDTGGILDEDWETPLADKLRALWPLLARRV